MAAFSSSTDGLILARALMGIGGACIYPSTLSILTNIFEDSHERARAIGIWAGVSGLGVAIGPLVGGLLLEHFWWGSVFLVNVPICATAIILGVFLVPSTRRDPDSKLDVLGAVLSIVGLVGVLYAIIEVPDRGWSDPGVQASLALGLAFLGLFGWWETHSRHPMLDLRFFKNPRFTAASATITMTFFALYGSTFLLTQYFQFVLGYSPLKAGMLTAPVAVGIMVTAPQAPKLVERIGTKLVVVLGLCIVATALLLYSSNTLMSSLLYGCLVRLMFGVGMGFTTAPATESIMGSLPKAKAGVGSAVNDTTRQTGGALGVAVIGSIFAFRYHSVVRPPPGLPAGRPGHGPRLDRAGARRHHHVPPAAGGRPRRAPGGVGGLPERHAAGRDHQLGGRPLRGIRRLPVAPGPPRPVGPGGRAGPGIRAGGPGRREGLTDPADRGSVRRALLGRSSPGRRRRRAGAGRGPLGLSSGHHGLSEQWDRSPGRPR